MSSFANTFQNTTNVEQLFYKMWALIDPSQVVFYFAEH